MITLNRVRLWPASSLPQLASLEDVSASISHLGPCPSGHGPCACNIRAYLEQAADYAKRQQPGLCAECVSEDELTRDGGNCSAALPHLCASLEQADSRSFSTSPFDGGLRSALGKDQSHAPS